MVILPQILQLHLRNIWIFHQQIIEGIVREWLRRVRFRMVLHGITLNELDDAEKRITIEYLEPFTVLYERKKGNYHDLSDEWCDFIEKYKYFSTEDTLYIECTINDPSITDENSC